jgi:hypothetical protein
MARRLPQILLATLCFATFFAGGSFAQATEPTPVADASRPATAMLRVDVAAGARQGAVVIDGRVRGTTPARVKLSSGVHTVQIDWGDCRSPSRTVSLRGGDDLTVRFAVPKVPPSATVSVMVPGDTPGARVFVDGRVRGATPITLRIAPGVHDFELRWDDGAVHRRRLDVRSGARLQLTGRR